MFARHRLWLWGFVLISVAAGGFAYRQHKRYKHWAVHQPGMVYRSAWLEPDVFVEQIEKHQIRTVLNLCNPGEMGEARCVDERRAVEGAGARLIELPMPAASVDSADPEIQQFVEVLSNPRNYPLLVHCQHGVTRTAKVLAMYDILFRGQSAAASIAAMPLFGRDEYSVSVRAFAKDFEKRHAQLYPQADRSLDVLHR
ncbi:MAG: fused DSP-PTPase phosphatase/NAD kinase-like protein [Planctomycetaceae bacterium]